MILEEEIILRRRVPRSDYKHGGAEFHDQQKASTRISKKSVGRCYCFCDSSVVAKWLYMSYPQEGRAMKA